MARSVKGGVIGNENWRIAAKVSREVFQHVKSYLPAGFLHVIYQSSMVRFASHDEGIQS